MMKFLPVLNFPKLPMKKKLPAALPFRKPPGMPPLIPMEVARKALEVMPVIADIARLGNRNAITDACSHDGGTIRRIGGIAECPH